MLFFGVKQLPNIRIQDDEVSCVVSILFSDLLARSFSKIYISSENPTEGEKDHALLLDSTMSGSESRGQEGAYLKVAEEQQLPTADEQLERIGLGVFHYRAIACFVLFIMSDGMELSLTNVVFRALPRTKWGMVAEDRANLVSIVFLGFVFGESRTPELIRLRSILAAR